MGASNLPPGVSEGMIPGNRPEDEEFDKFLDILQKRTQDEIEEKELHFPNLPENWYEDDGIILMVTHARDIGYDAGFLDGKTEASLPPDEEELQKREGIARARAYIEGGNIIRVEFDTRWNQFGRVTFMECAQGETPNDILKEAFKTRPGRLIGARTATVYDAEELQALEEEEL